MSEMDRSLPHYEVRVFLRDRESRGQERDAGIANLLGLPVGPAYGTDLNAVVSELNSRGYWWSLSHNQASVCPTAEADGPLRGLVSNAGIYDREGQAIFYRASLFDVPAAGLCEAWIKAVYDLPPAFAVVASYRDEVMAKEPESRESRMIYYKAREASRQRAIADWKREHAAPNP